MKGKHRSLDRVVESFVNVWKDTLRDEVSLTTEPDWPIAEGRASVQEWIAVATALYRRTKLRQVIAYHHALGRRTTRSDWRPLIIETSRPELISYLSATAGCAPAVAEVVIGTLTAHLDDPEAKPSAFRMHERPLLAAGDRIAWGSYHLQHIQMARVLEDHLAEPEKQRAGAHFVEAMKARLGQLGPRSVAAHVRYESSAGEGDIDLVVWWRDFLFLFECKAMLGIVRGDRVKNRYAELEKAADQALRSQAFAVSSPEQFGARVRMSPDAVRQSTIVPGILLSGPLFDGALFKGVPTLNADYLLRQAPQTANDLWRLLTEEPAATKKDMSKPASTQVNDYLFTWE